MEESAPALAAAPCMHIEEVHQTELGVPPREASLVVGLERTRERDGPD